MALTQAEKDAIIDALRGDETYWTKDEIERLCKRVAEQDPPTVVVIIQGGNYQGSAASEPVDLQILDYDNFNDPDCSSEQCQEYRAMVALFNELSGENVS